MIRRGRREYGGTDWLSQGDSSRDNPLSFSGYREDAPSPPRLICQGGGLRKRRGGFSPSGGRRSVASGMIRRERNGYGRADRLSKLESNQADSRFLQGGARLWNDPQGRGARCLTGLSLGGVHGGGSLSRGRRSVAPGMIRQKRGVVRLANSV